MERVCAASLSCSAAMVVFTKALINLGISVPL